MTAPASATPSTILFATDLSSRCDRALDRALILATCQAESPELIVTGVARKEALSRAELGSTVDALAHRSPVPLLLVPHSD